MTDADIADWAFQGIHLLPKTIYENDAHKSKQKPKAAAMMKALNISARFAVPKFLQHKTA